MQANKEVTMNSEKKDIIAQKWVEEYKEKKLEIKKQDLRVLSQGMYMVFFCQAGYF